MSKRCVLYARVSTRRDQHTESQLRALRDYALARGWRVIEEATDEGFSGKSEKRPGYKRVMELVRKRRVDVLVVTKLDRLFRSLRSIVTTLQEFNDLGVEFVSINDQLDLTTASGRLMLHIVAAFAEFELALVKERTFAGLENAVAKGKKLGRPRLGLDEEIIRLRASGWSYRSIQDGLQCSSSVIRRAILSASKSPLENYVNTQQNFEVDW